MLKSFLELISRLTRKQDGQVIILGVGLFILTLAALMITVDVGYWLSDKRNAQNVADAIALAGAQELPDTTAAVDAGRTWANNNGINPETQLATDVTCAGVTADGGRFCFEDMSGDGDADLVRVQVQRNSRSFIAGAFGVATPTVKPRAAAGKLHIIASCVKPWAIDVPEEFEGDPEVTQWWNAWDPHTLFAFQLSAGDFQNGSSGNFGALAVYGNGAVNYRDTITKSCAELEGNACDSEEKTLEQGQLLPCETQTGALGQNTKSALEELLAAEAPDYPCDVETDAEPGDVDDDAYFEAEGKSTDLLCRNRMFPLAVIEDFPPQGSSADVIVYGIGDFYLAEWDRCNPLGNGDCDGAPGSGMVWGFMVPGTAKPSWEFKWGDTDNPFAPVVVKLVE
jgi:hypothetical protein